MELGFSSCCVGNWIMSLQKEEFIRRIVWVLTTCGVPIV